MILKRWKQWWYITMDADSQAFLSAAAEGRTEEVLSMLASDPSLLLTEDEEGNTALHLAAAGKGEAIVGHLLNVSWLYVCTELMNCSANYASPARPGYVRK